MCNVGFDKYCFSNFRKCLKSWKIFFVNKKSRLYILEQKVAWKLMFKRLSRITSSSITFKVDVQSNESMWTFFKEMALRKITLNLKKITAQCKFSQILELTIIEKFAQPFSPVPQKCLKKRKVAPAQTPIASDKCWNASRGISQRIAVSGDARRAKTQRVSPRLSPEDFPISARRRPFSDLPTDFTSTHISSI